MGTLCVFHLNVLFLQQPTSLSHFTLAVLLNPVPAPGIAAAGQQLWSVQHFAILEHLTARDDILLL